jgi:hypothetical protein
MIEDFQDYLTAAECLPADAVVKRALEIAVEDPWLSGMLWMIASRKCVVMAASCAERYVDDLKARNKL